MRWFKQALAFGLWELKPWGCKLWRSIILILQSFNCNYFRRFFPGRKRGTNSDDCSDSIVDESSGNAGATCIFRFGSRLFFSLPFHRDSVVVPNRQQTGVRAQEFLRGPIVIGPF
jgi:hypothetical protein